MNGSIFVFNRRVSGESGQPLLQTITVFADNLDAALGVLNRELADVRTHTTALAQAYLADPAWQALEVPLDKEKVITSAVTQ